MGILIVMMFFIIVIIVFVITGNFWKTEEQGSCSYCKGELSTCKITVTNDSGTNVYCNPYCLEQGLKKDAETES